MDVIQVHDLLNINEDNEILNLLKGEKVYYSDVITKINHYGLSQERSIILTDVALYNMKKKELKRRIPYKEILGISYSNISNEFVIHGNNCQYDYHYNSQDKNLIISLIIFFYDEQDNSKIKICEIPEKSLKNYVTRKKEKQKDCTYTKMDKNYLIDTVEFQENNMELLFFGNDIDINKNPGYNISNVNNINNLNNDSIDNINSNAYKIYYSSTNSDNNKIEGKKSNNLNFLSNINININNTQKEKNKEGTIFSKNKDIKKVSLNDFKLLKVLGRGTFGKVCLAQYKATKKYYAMKIMKKNIILEHNQVTHTLLEKNILQNLNYQFLVGMDFCFQTQERIYFAMNFIRGGELFSHLYKCKYFPEEKAKFYSAIVGLALEYLHTHGIVYRDIKPDNILIDEDGYLKLADFGMSKMLKDQEKAFSLCGTPEYFAPEIITREGHNKSADWWSYGILLYEMLYGIPPFYSKNTEKMFELITKAKLKFPQKIEVSDDAKDLIKKLLVKNQDLRLGCEGGFEEIKKHSFFKGFDFKALEEKKLEAPFIPTLRGSIDVTNFDRQYTSEEIVTSEISPKTLEFIKKNQDLFEDFE
jgi:tRNA A-37 threonylcarbamoyl transferase component Bud32